MGSHKLYGMGAGINPSGSFILGTEQVLWLNTEEQQVGMEYGERQVNVGTVLQWEITGRMEQNRVGEEQSVREYTQQ